MRNSISALFCLGTLLIAFWAFIREKKQENVQEKNKKKTNFTESSSTESSSSSSSPSFLVK